MSKPSSGIAKIGSEFTQESSVKIGSLMEFQDEADEKENQYEKDEKTTKGGVGKGVGGVKRSSVGNDDCVGFQKTVLTAPANFAEFDKKIAIILSASSKTSSAANIIAVDNYNRIKSEAARIRIRRKIVVQYLRKIIFSTETTTRTLQHRTRLLSEPSKEVLKTFGAENLSLCLPSPVEDLDENNKSPVSPVSVVLGLARRKPKEIIAHTTLLESPWERKLFQWEVREFGIFKVLTELKLFGQASLAVQKWYIKDFIYNSLYLCK